MKKNKFFAFKLNYSIISIIFFAFTMCLILFSSSNIDAAKSGLKLWVNSIIPCLFPFFVATNLLSHTNIPYIFKKLFNFIMHPIFNISGEGSFALFMGWLSRISHRSTNSCRF